MSVGVAVWPTDANLEELLKAADRLFYVEVGGASAAPSRELVWEVRVVGGREDTRRLLWISVLTGTVTQLYPAYDE